MAESERMAFLRAPFLKALCEYPMRQKQMGGYVPPIQSSCFLAPTFCAFLCVMRMLSWLLDDELILWLWHFSTPLYFLGGVVPLTTTPL